MTAMLATLGVVGFFLICTVALVIAAFTAAAPLIFIAWLIHRLLDRRAEARYHAELNRRSKPWDT